MTQPISVVVCVKNEEARLADCLKTIQADHPDEIVVVDGNSSDRTVEIAKKHTHLVIVSQSGSLTADRQVGIDAAKNEFVAMIDADHRIVPGDLNSLVNDLESFGFDLVQSQLISYTNHSFWNAAEEEAWDITHNFPGPKFMIGTAPAVYKKKIFEKVRFDADITKKMDDTDFIYRLSQHKEFKFGIGRTRVRQLHFPDFKSYLKKFFWYGHGDGEFCKKHPERTGRILYNIGFRYPFVYSAKAIAKGRMKAVPFFIIQGAVRILGLAVYIYNDLAKVNTHGNSQT